MLERYAAPLARWMERQVPEVVLPVQTALVSGGRSNLTFLLTDAAGQRFVLRRPPLGSHPGTAHDVLREAAIVSALTGSGVPVAPVLGSSADPETVGAPFFVMRFVEGTILTRPGDVTAHTPRRRLAADLVATLAAVHRVDLDAVGLAHLRRPAGYVQRQLRRLGRVLDPHSVHLDLALRVRDGLERHVPPESLATLLHGDFKLGNMIVGADGVVRAVLDWELASTGDPVADLGWLVASWAQPDDGTWIVPPATTAGGFPSRAEVANLYAAASGRDVDTLDYYVAFAYWRWSCINIGTRRRFLAGKEGGGTAIDIGALDEQVEWQLDMAARLLGAPARG